MNYNSILSLHSAPSRNILNLETWFENNIGAIIDSETESLRHKDELVSISAHKSTMCELLERHLMYRNREKLGLFKCSPQSISSPQIRGSLSTISDTTINRLGPIAVFLAVAMMLILPLWTLPALGSMQIKLFAISFFFLGWLTILSCANLGRPFEKLAATAGQVKLKSSRNCC